MQLSPLFLEKIQAAERKGEARGEVKEGQSLVLRLLERRLGNISLDLET